MGPRRKNKTAGWRRYRPPSRGWEGAPGQESMQGLAGVRKTVAYYLTDLPVRLLAKTPVSPNTLSWLGFILAVGAATLVGWGYLLAAGFVVLFAGFLDILDGALARRTNRVSRFGAVLDATLDRASEAALLLGILALFLLSSEQPLLFASIAREWSVVLVFIALLGSVLVSYIRARAETLSVDCQIGLFTRGERVIVLVLGLFLNQITEWALPAALAIILAFSAITVVQRLVHVWQQTKNR